MRIRQSIQHDSRNSKNSNKQWKCVLEQGNCCGNQYHISASSEWIIKNHRRHHRLLRYLLFFEPNLPQGSEELDSDDVQSLTLLQVSQSRLLRRHIHRHQLVSEHV